MAGCIINGEQDNPVKPERLKPGDVIGIVAPASPFDTNMFDQGIAVLKSMGFNVFIPDDVAVKKGYFAGSDVHRANILNRLFADSSIKAIVCARGGFGSIKILPLLDFEAVKKNPKIFCGFSDITALLSVLSAGSGLVTFHGPVITTLGSAGQRTKDALLAAFTQDTKLEIILETGVALKPGTCTGTVSGGNLASLCHLVGTPYAQNFEGHIVLLEEINEAPYRIDRMLTQMKLAGCFDRISGLMLGYFKGCGAMDEIYKIVDNIFKGINIPILAGFEAGHGENNITIPLGLKATLDTYKNVLWFHEVATVQCQATSQ